MRPDTAAEFERWRRDTAARVEAALDAAMPGADTHPARLHEAMRYATLGGGKRVRALLVHAAAGLVGAPDDLADACASAVELVHAYSLVHDDLPCMDDDALRRGRPTVHVAYDEATAMLVGDGLQALAFEILAAALCRRPAAPAAVMICELARAAGPSGMVGGQAIDVAATGSPMSREALEAMHRRKTGAMLAVSVRLGALAGLSGDAARDDPRLPILDRYGEAIGLAFQVVDDVLDVVGDAQALGKTPGKDADRNKPTYVSILGLEKARELAGALRAEAAACLAGLGPAAGRLESLADLIVGRSG